jgi:hypothetical protein
MKKLFTLLTVLLMHTASFAQDFAPIPNLAKGNLLLEVGSSSGSIGDVLGKYPSTGFNLRSTNGNVEWSAGGEAGYFIKDGLAIKAGLGYTSLGESEDFLSYKLGAKYYIVDKIPVQVDLSGSSGTLFDGFDDPFFLGLQGGYAAFLNKNISLEPSFRYNIGLSNFTDVVELRLNFCIFL